MNAEQAEKSARAHAAHDYETMWEKNEPRSAVPNNDFRHSYPTKESYVEEWWEERYLPLVITYAKAGGPPVIWTKLNIFDGDTQLMRCKEVNTVEGWAWVWVGQGHFTMLRSKNLRIERI